jgi:hypothetical protein
MDRQVVTVLLEPVKAEFHVSDTPLGLLGGFSFARPSFHKKPDERLRNRQFLASLRN